VLQLPQWAASDARSTHVAPHSVNPDRQTQLPETQSLPSPQTVPQAPQFAGSVAAVTHRVPHCSWPAAQLPCAPPFDTPPVAVPPLAVPPLLVAPPRPPLFTWKFVGASLAEQDVSTPVSALVRDRQAMAASVRIFMVTC
jgi:hypothetical protein